METVIKKQLLDKFSEIVTQKYQHYCEMHQIDSNDEQNIITYLIDHQIIKPKTIKDYTISHEYEALVATNQQRTQSVKKLADRFAISERAVWLVLKGRSLKIQHK
ncbi:MAG: hypothetical protein HC892_04965 [Saprospiraceae bacterium]|nr:hypothetical protein [Saprospiraceae bacterium]